MKQHMLWFAALFVEITESAVMNADEESSGCCEPQA